MSTITNNLLRAATLVFAIAGSTAAIAQTTSTTVGATGSGSATATAITGKSATSTAAQNAVAATAVAASKAQQPAGLTRAQVQAEFLEARKNGTLLETEADFDVAQTRKHFSK